MATSSAEWDGPEKLPDNEPDTESTHEETDTRYEVVSEEDTGTGIPIEFFIFTKVFGQTSMSERCRLRSYATECGI